MDGPFISSKKQITHDFSWLNMDTQVD